LIRFPWIERLFVVPFPAMQTCTATGLHKALCPSNYFWRILRWTERMKGHPCRQDQASRLGQANHALALVMTL
jgi:hypothetical protein